MTSERIYVHLQLPGPRPRSIGRSSPIYRLYNNPATVAAVNHRFTADGATYAAMQAAGWIGEGVAFCTR